MQNIVKPLLISLFLLPLSFDSAHAINCEGPYQIINGSRHQTPFCADNYIARVARSYGYSVSNSEVRNNANKKIEICTQLGSDSRIKELCGAYRLRLR